ncbi:hypothetical protein [Ammoniphilus sp. YIM 78166]|uniref:hypothetical protein n=1 Tax=Ammoniphilus sp. YIM 78166 TaxID=1644106 RepID=UPI00106FC7F7|nr:hypothetical protein [Ammoniphilus sp. YIM 78166]
MIHRDLCNPNMTKSFSSLRMQFNFLLSRYVCWDGFIPLTLSEMAEKLRCDNQSIRKFIKKGIQDDMLRLEGDRLYLNKKVDEFSQGYIKHYPFLESAEFRSMSVHGQRFVLYTLWAGVHTGRPLKRDLSTLYHSKEERNGVLNLYYREPIYLVLDEVQQFLKLEIVTEKNREMVRVTGLQDQYAYQEALANEGEQKLLQEILLDHGVDELVSATSREDILKLKKHYLSSLQSVGLELFTHALKKLLSVHKLYELDMQGEIGKYLRSILVDLEQKILPTLHKQVFYVTKAIQTMEDTLVSGASLWIKRFEKQKQIITQAIQKIKSKIDPPCEENIPFVFYNWLENV